MIFFNVILTSSETISQENWYIDKYVRYQKDWCVSVIQGTLSPGVNGDQQDQFNIRDYY